MGAIAAAAGAKEIAAMGRFGVLIGEAFQIIDDILDNGDSVRLLGREGAYKKAGLISKEAKSALGMFSDKAAALKGIADYLIARRI
jgi:geranylgeranyl pyrophosphate synthase